MQGNSFRLVVTGLLAASLFIGAVAASDLGSSPTTLVVRDAFTGSVFAARTGKAVRGADASGFVEVVSTTGKRVSIPIAGSPIDVAMATSAGKVVVATNSPSSVVLIDADTLAPHAIPLVGDVPAKVFALDGAGKAYVGSTIAVPAGFNGIGAVYRGRLTEVSLEDGSKRVFAFDGMGVDYVVPGPYAGQLSILGRVNTNLTSPVAGTHSRLAVLDLESGDMRLVGGEVGKGYSLSRMIDGQLSVVADEVVLAGINTHYDPARVLAFDPFAETQSVRNVLPPNRAYQLPDGSPVDPGNAFSGTVLASASGDLLAVVGRYSDVVAMDFRTGRNQTFQVGGFPIGAELDGEGGLIVLFANGWERRSLGGALQTSGVLATVSLATTQRVLRGGVLYEVDQASGAVTSFVIPKAAVLAKPVGKPRFFREF